MPNNPFDRTIYNLREKPLSPDQNRALSQQDYALRAVLSSMLSARSAATTPGSSPQSGCIGEGLRVVPSSPAAVSVVVKAGLAFANLPSDTPSAIGSVVGLDDLSPYKPIVLMADTTLSVPAPPGANSRIDIIEVKPRRLKGDPQSRLILDPGTGAFTPNSVDKTLSFIVDGDVGSVNDPNPSTASLSYKTGIVSASPVAPTVTSGYMKLAEVRVSSATTTISGSNIGDYRKLLSPNGILTASCRFRVLWNGGAPSITMLNVAAPPGVEIAARGISSVRSLAQVYCIAGSPSQVNVIAHAESPATVVSAATINFRTREVTFGDLTGGEQTNFAAATPAILAAVGSRRTILECDAVLRDAAGAGSTVATDLESIVYNAMFLFGYY